MGWVDKAHECTLPLVCQYRPELGRLFECDHCKRTWEVVETSPYGEFNFYVKFESRLCDTRMVRYMDERGVDMQQFFWTGTHW